MRVEELDIDIDIDTALRLLLMSLRQGSASAQRLPLPLSLRSGACLAERANTKTSTTTTHKPHDALFCSALQHEVESSIIMYYITTIIRYGTAVSNIQSHPIPSHRPFLEARHRPPLLTENLTIDNPAIRNHDKPCLAASFAMLDVHCTVWPPFSARHDMT